MNPFTLTKTLWGRLTGSKRKAPSHVLIDPAILGSLPDQTGVIAQITKTLVFGKEAIEDFHCAQALHNGEDEYGRVYVDFDEKRREHVMHCIIRMACKNAKARKATNTKAQDMKGD